MKYTNLRAFEKHLEGSAPKHFSNTYLLASKEPYARKMGLEKALHYLLQGQQNPHLIVKTMEGDSLVIEELMSELNSTSFFSDRLIFVIQNADKLKKNATVALESYMERPCPNTFLLLVAPTIAANTNFYKKIEKNGVILDVAPEKPWEKEKSLAEWIGSVVAAGGKKIGFDVAQHLVKHCGTDQELLSREIEKLFCYAGDRPEITLADVGAICCSVNMETVWQLGEAIFRRDAATSLKITKALLNEGTALLALVKQIRNQFQTDFQVCTILSQGGTSQQVAAQFPYMKGFILDRHVQMSQSYGMQRFRSGIIALDETELQAKNSGGDPNLLAELLIIKLAT